MRPTRWLAFLWARRCFFFADVAAMAAAQRLLPASATQPAPQFSPGACPSRRSTADQWGGATSFSVNPSLPQD